MLGIPVGLLTCNLTEWLFHKYVLHGLGSNKKSIWASHWHSHHKIARKNNMVDHSYDEPVMFTSETFALMLGGLVLAPLLPYFPFFVTTMWVSGATYYIVHRKAHLDPLWAKKYLRHHYDHHMIGNQSHNWNVTLPIWDYILGTRVKA